MSTTTIRSNIPSQLGAGLTVFPVEIWRECFKNATRWELKILSIVCRQFAAIFQPLFFNKEIRFGGSFLQFAHSPADIEVASPFWQQYLRGRNKSNWETYFKPLIRAERRFHLLSSSPRLSGYVREILIGSENNRSAAVLQYYGQEIVSRHENSLGWLTTSLPQFTGLRRLTLDGVALFPAMMKVIEGFPLLDELRITECAMTEDLTTFCPPALSTITLDFNDTHSWQPIWSRSIPPWGSWTATLISATTITTCVLNLRQREYLPSMRIFASLRNFRSLTSFTSLTVPIPSCYLEAADLVRVLEISPNLETLELLQREEDGGSLDLPSIPPTCAPLLKNIICTLEWAERLCPGRPIEVLQVGITFNEELEERRKEIPALATLKTLALTTGDMQCLELPSLGTGIHVLEAVGELFPFLKIINLTIPDVGKIVSPPDLENIPSISLKHGQDSNPLYDFPPLRVVTPPADATLEDVKVAFDSAKDAVERALKTAPSTYKGERSSFTKSSPSVASNLCNRSGAFSSATPAIQIDDLAATPSHSVAGALYRVLSSPSLLLPSCIEDLHLAGVNAHPHSDLYESLTAPHAAPIPDSITRSFEITFRSSSSYKVTGEG